ncbi:MAG: PCMD domain-containing protein [Muribaculaceae bacterium]|nr:PCMD domain-containing protein [Muribaculaceae bacterium]
MFTFKTRSLEFHALKTAFALGAVMLAGSCLKDDIPYPRIQANFLSIEADGVTAGPVIDSLNRTVSLAFPETADIYNVDITAYTLTPGAHIVGDSITGGIDLSQPKSVTLRLYQDYEWTITADRPIERYFTVSSQIGTAEIDVPGRRVIVTVSSKADLKAIEILTCKLGPQGATMTPELAGRTVDMSNSVEIEVDDWGHKSVWTIYTDTSDATVTTSSVDAWSMVAWVYGEAQAGRTNGFEYRLSGDTQWTRLPQSEVMSDGGSFRACLKHLSPGAGYEVRAFSDDEYGEVLEFTTGAVPQIPNSDFDQWWLDGKVWNPWPEGGEQVWDTGNKGATTLGTSNSMPTEDTSSGTGWAAMLETRFVGIGMIGKLAAGNIFVGRYVRTDGTNGVLSFGHPFSDKPTKVRGYMKYKTAPVSSVTAGFEYMKGLPDTCIIWCALIDQPEPLEIRTNPSNRQIFDPDGSYVVAYGKVEFGQDVNSYIPFEFELDYKSTSRTPRYILLTASASKYGDYFTGGNGAVLYVDNLELEYDY